jgi:hypothetical protein
MDTLDTQGLKTFIDDAMANRKETNKRVKIGDISETAQARLKDKFGFNIPEVDTDNSSVIHAMQKAAHNLEPDDLLHAVDVINTSEDITLSEEEHQNNKVLEFKKDINGELTILAEVHAKGGYLLVFNAWRKKKALRHTTADTGEGKPGANVRNASQRAYSPLSDTSEKKSSPGLPGVNNHRPWEPKVP